MRIEELESRSAAVTSSASSDDLENLLPALASVLLLHSNAFELWHYLHAHLPVLRKGWVSANPDDSESDVITALEDTVLCTFQQTAYHITKVRVSVNSTMGSDCVMLPSSCKLYCSNRRCTRACHPFSRATRSQTTTRRALASSRSSLSCSRCCSCCSSASLTPTSCNSCSPKSSSSSTPRSSTHSWMTVSDHDCVIYYM